jgi:hypothetical protein
MGIEVKKEEGSSGGISFINQLIMTLEESEKKLEEAYKKDKPEQVSAIKQFILKIQKKIADELK